MSTYTVQITFDRGKNLPVADIGTLSCDPYVLAELIVPDTDPLKFRTPTIHHTRDPTWNSSWLVSGVPSSGFKLLMILYDEDPGAILSADRLGKAVAQLSPEQMKEGFESIETEYVLQKRKGDLHPYILTYLTALLPGEKLRKHNRVVVSIRVLCKDADKQGDRRMYTLGPNRYSRHFSPLIGSMVNKKSQKDASDSDGQTDGKGTKLSSTTFIANKLQLTGPVPRELRHRFVGYRPFINWMFADSGIAGRILYHGLRKQYRTVYACDKSTVWGVIDDVGVTSSNGIKPVTTLRGATPESSEALARQFLGMTAWGEGGKLFTYVITLDGEWRFTETGPEFAIDLLSKHSMHADLAKEIAYSGEFFVQPFNATKEPVNGSAEHALNGHARSSEDAAVPDQDAQPNGNATEPAARNPKAYELVIDNDSGTYRPKKELLPLFEAWLADASRLGGLGRVRAMDGFDKGLEKMKEGRKTEKETLTGWGKKDKKGKGKGKDKDEGEGAAGEDKETVGGTGKMVLVRKGSSVNSIGGGVVRKESVSSQEVEGALKNPESHANGDTQKTD
ncbi:hypothetical protein DFH07DRAFT_765537 [Mycena maculata]|uniref:C2 domain-containing protein n=1 Tax=Mycena maculata TaxID=230809 RepID=A0AAD7K833_9AGAR|nr:hypothetical protein DFH07DRAFT_765537 [Mycena maculata]